MEIISRFDPSGAEQAHGGSILAAPVLPEGLRAPFEHAWGYLPGPGEMEPHNHPTEEVYIFTHGEGFVTVDGQKYAVGPGDVAYIPPNAMHSVINEADAPLQWAAYWWMPL